MSIVLDKYGNKNIDKKYIDENIEEILNNLVKIFPDESHKKSNWKRSLNERMSGFNILSAVIHKICKNTEKMFSRIDIFHEKEVALEESIQRNHDVYKRHQESSDQFREIQYIMIKKLKSKLSVIEYEEFVNEDLSSFNRGYFGF
jgi:hypothetical protein